MATKKPKGKGLVTQATSANSSQTQGAVALASGSGAFIQPVYAMRRIVYFAVSAHDIATLTLVNTGIAVAVGLGTFLLGVAAPTIVAFIERLAQAEAERTGLAPSLGTPLLLLVLAVAAFVVTGVLIRFRAAEVSRIERESFVPGGITTPVAQSTSGKSVSPP